VKILPEPDLGVLDEIAGGIVLLAFKAGVAKVGLGLRRFPAPVSVPRHHPTTRRLWRLPCQAPLPLRQPFGKVYGFIRRAWSRRKDSKAIAAISKGRAKSMEPMISHS
jgi:hypothetical protein